MSDQCKHCTLRGDVKQCEAEPCFQRENWWAIEIIKERDRLRTENAELVEALKNLYAISEPFHRDTDADWVACKNQVKAVLAKLEATDG